MYTRTYSSTSTCAYDGVAIRRECKDRVCHTLRDVRVLDNWASWSRLQRHSRSQLQPRLRWRLAASWRRSSTHGAFTMVTTLRPRQSPVQARACSRRTWPISLCVGASSMRPIASRSRTVAWRVRTTPTAWYGKRSLWSTDARATKVTSA
jgi:hypothetical protein